MYYNSFGKPVDDLMDVAFDSPDRIIAQDRIDTWSGAIVVSTVALMINHQFHLGGPPLIFETMIFKVDLSGEWIMDEQFADRYATRDGAAIRHRQIVRYLHPFWRRWFWRRSIAGVTQVWGRDA